MSKSAEAVREIDAAKHRLSKAKSASDFASKMAALANEKMASARTHRDSVHNQIEALRTELRAANSQLLSAKSHVDMADEEVSSCKKELADAQSNLETVEERWNVIDVDENSVSQSGRVAVRVSPTADRSSRTKSNISGASNDKTGNGDSLRCNRLNTLAQYGFGKKRKFREETEDQRRVEKTKELKMERKENTHESDLQSDIDRHCQQTKALLKEAAARGLSSVPVQEMMNARNKNLSAMRTNANLMYQSGGKYVGELELTSKLAKAEADAVGLYIAEMNKKRKNASSAHTSTPKQTEPSQNKKS